MDGLIILTYRCNICERLKSRANREPMDPKAFCTFISRVVVSKSIKPCTRAIRCPYGKAVKPLWKQINKVFIKAGDL